MLHNSMIIQKHKENVFFFNSTLLESLKYIVLLGNINIRYFVCVESWRISSSFEEEKNSSPARGLKKYLKIEVARRNDINTPKMILLGNILVCFLKRLSTWFSNCI